MKKSKFELPLVSNVLFVAAACAVMLGAVYYITYEQVLEAIVVGFLLFVAIDTGLSSLLGKPSWILNTKKLS
jgi:hypothetical protein